MAEKKKNMYEVLEVPPTASQAELKAAHRRLSLATMANPQGLSREESDYRLQLLDVALHTLFDPSSRAAYDLQLAAANAVNVSFPVASPSASVAGEGRALQLATAVEEMYKTQLASRDEGRFQFGAVAETLGASGRSLTIILRIVFWLLLLGLVVRMGGCALAVRQPPLPPAAVATAEEMLIIQAYYKTHGVRAANRAEVAALEAENRRQENERREAEFILQKADDEHQRFVEETRENALRLEQEQQRAEAEARYEAIRRQREAQSARRASEE